MPLPTEADVRGALEPVIDPEFGLSVLDLGLVYGIAISAEGAVHVTFTATTRGCPVTEVLARGIFRAVSALDGVTAVSTELVWEPPWDPSRIAPDALRRLEER
ncbi:MAG TPA: metal-sulfur cluster assembly factor [Thermoanaerobaculia bacterium]|nr:metal-sulfur cluster assembly factor [Thermoanaerobaculia bacterium]